MALKQKITPNLWFDDQAEEAANFYVSIFDHSSIGKTSRYGKEGYEVHGMKEGTVLTVEFFLEGQQFLALNGGPHFKFSEAISFVVHCKDQKELDYFWNKLSEGGEEQMCGWLKDKFGLSWQIVPEKLGELLSGSEPGQSARVMRSLMQMKKLDLATLEREYRGK